MKKLTTNKIRTMWINFFKTKNHFFLKPVSLIPIDDPSLLWINSGVATLKPYFDGRKIPPASRLTNSQKAIRTSDIENVGITSHHHTMFEMLGNFSIGDYFKNEAISFAWELLTSKEWFDISKEKLYITVFEEDIDAYAFWINEIKIEYDHIFKMSRKTNFWDIGQGPCGPNTEIFYDRGEKWDVNKTGLKLLTENIENNRYIEIWNIVFSQYDNDGENNYSDLPKKNIDTGAGLERIASIFQKTPTNFETDIFWPTIMHLQKICNPKFKYLVEDYFAPKQTQTKINTAFKVIADHIRAISFAIADGVFPNNKDRGYIIRRLIRRALIKGIELGIEGAFLASLVKDVIIAMKKFYSYLLDKQDIIEETINGEEWKFLKTLKKGYEMLKKIIRQEHEVSGKNALLLFESYGYPIESIIELAKERNIKVNLFEFKQLLEKTKEKARSARKNLKAWEKQNAIFTKIKGVSEFIGWKKIKYQNAKVIYIFTENKILNQATNQEVYVILDKTPFYAEKGGQVADTGTFIGKNMFGNVIDTQQGPNTQHIHKVIVKGTLKLKDIIIAQVNKEKREKIMKNHSGTHLLHSALRVILGPTVMQSGSFNDEHSLRIDFTYNYSVTNEELNKIEKLVNQKIQQKINLEVYFCSMKDAINKYNALAFFAEKYDDVVRVIKFGDFSSELCGGTHVNNTQNIENFLIIGLESTGRGIFRIKCLTSQHTILNYLEQEFNKLKNEIKIYQDKYLIIKKQIKYNYNFEKSFAEINKMQATKVNIEKIKKLLKEIKGAWKLIIKQLRSEKLYKQIASYKNFQPKINAQGVLEINEYVYGLDINAMKTLVDEYKNKYESIVILRSSFNDANFVIVGVSKKLQQKNFSAINIFKNLIEKPKGGGNSSLAQGKYCA